MTKKELQAALDELGVKYDSKATNAELEKLLEEAKGQSTPSVEEAEEETTDVEAEAETEEETSEEEPDAGDSGESTPDPKFVIAENLMHNNAQYFKGDSADELPEEVFAELKKLGHLVKYEPPKPEAKDVVSGKKKGKLVFANSTMHDGVMYAKGDDASKLDAGLKTHFESKGLLTVQ